MSEIFTVVCSNVAVSAAQDILTAYAASTKKLQLLAVEIAANGQTVVGNYPIRIRQFGAAVTAGSGGSTPTPNNVNPDGAAASFTAHANDTTHATSGSAKDIVSSQFNPINGYYWTPPVGVGDEVKCDLSGAIVLSLDAAPAASINLSATLWLREI
jgi:hypothetical protein